MGQSMDNYETTLLHRSKILRVHAVVLWFGGNTVALILSVVHRYPSRFMESLLLPLDGCFFQSGLGCFVVPEVRSHKALPEFTVIGDGEVQKFVDDDVVA